MAWHFVLDKSVCVPLFERETPHYPPWLIDTQRGRNLDNVNATLVN